MTKIPHEELVAIRAVLLFAERYGYGNMIAHLRTAWARMLVKEFDMSFEQACEATENVTAYPAQLQLDILTRGEWDDTGERYLSQIEKGTT